MQGIEETQVDIEARHKTIQPLSILDNFISWRSHTSSLTPTNEQSNLLHCSKIKFLELCFAIMKLICIAYYNWKLGNTCKHLGNVNSKPDADNEMPPSNSTHRQTFWQPAAFLTPFPIFQLTTFSAVNGESLIYDLSIRLPFGPIDIFNKFVRRHFRRSTFNRLPWHSDDSITPPHTAGRPTGHRRVPPTLPKFQIIRHPSPAYIGAIVSSRSAGRGSVKRRTNVLGRGTLTERKRALARLLKPRTSPPMQAVTFRRRMRFQPSSADVEMPAQTWRSCRRRRLLSIHISLNYT